MFYSLHTMLIWVFIILVVIGNANGKSISGFLQSQHGFQHLYRFCFSVHGVLKIELNATNEDGHLVLFTDEKWHYLENKFHCETINKEAIHNVPLTEVKKIFHFQPTDKKTPTYMNLVYMQCSSDVKNPIIYQIEMMNQFSSTDLSQFDCSELDLLNLVQFFFIAYVVAFVLYGRRLYIIVKKGGPMHLALRMLTVAQIFRTGSFFVSLVHYYRYSANGIGFPYLLQLSKVLDGCCNYQILVMVAKLATGGILTSSPSYDFDEEKIIHNIVMCISFVQILFSLFGILGLVMLTQIILAVLLAYSLQKILNKERSALKRDFYHKLVRDNYLWWFSLAVAHIFSIIFSEYQQQKVILLTHTALQTVASLFFYNLFISRSLYWEVSSLASATLPLRIDNSFGMRKYTS